MSSVNVILPGFTPWEPSARVALSEGTHIRHELIAMSAPRLHLWEVLESSPRLFPIRSRFSLHRVTRSPDAFTRTFVKVVEYPPSMSLCQGLPGALETRVTFSEDMYGLFALIAFEILQYSCLFFANSPKVLFPSSKESTSSYLIDPKCSTPDY